MYGPMLSIRSTFFTLRARRPARPESVRVWSVWNVTTARKSVEGNELEANNTSAALDCTLTHSSGFTALPLLGDNRTTSEHKA
jgi:hypothetical protein